MFFNSHKIVWFDFVINISIAILFASIGLSLVLFEKSGIEEVILAFVFSISIFLKMWHHLYLPENQYKKFDILNFFLMNVNLVYLFTLIALLVEYTLVNIMNLSFQSTLLFNMVSLTFLNTLIFKRTDDIKDYIESHSNDIFVINRIYNLFGLKKHKYPQAPKNKNDEAFLSVVSHEVGHLIFALSSFREGDEVTISAISDGTSKGFVHTNQRDANTKNELEEEMIFLLGGSIGEFYELHKNGLKERIGRTTDMKKFATLALKYLKNGFDRKNTYIGVAIKEDKKIIEEINKKSFDNLHELLFNKGYLYLLENEEVYKEISEKLKVCPILYTKDLVEFKKKLKGSLNV